ncbi:hypothetical protein Bbelb_365370 [Branchiostoma belcheri]|nr:hypothetical protein Bbelb_365370 [Branchiostoma belcheri]
MRDAQVLNPVDARNALNPPNVRRRKAVGTFCGKVQDAVRDFPRESAGRPPGECDTFCGRVRYVQRESANIARRLPGERRGLACPTVFEDWTGSGCSVHYRLRLAVIAASVLVSLSIIGKRVLFKASIPEVADTNCKHYPHGIEYLRKIRMLRFTENDNDGTSLHIYGLYLQYRTHLHIHGQYLPYITNHEALTWLSAWVVHGSYRQ